MCNKSIAASYRILICSLIFLVCFLFAFCDSSANTGVDETDETLEFTCSHKSGLYRESFTLTLTANEESDIYYSIDGSIPLPSKVTNNGPVFKYSAPITVKDRNGQPNILATAANAPKMYPHPADPEEWKPLPYFPTANQVPKATVIRALAVNSNGKQSGVINRTFFIGDNLAQYGDHLVMSIITDPKNLLDDDIGIYVRGRGTSRYEYNYSKKGREWEREAYFDLFDRNRNAALSTGAGIRIRGGYTRWYGQKAFNVYFREEYGLKNLKNYDLIPGAVQSDGKTPIAQYKNFMLRNGGNDTEFTKLRDVYIQSLFGNRTFSTQAAVPCILYLNGEYWGFYNLQEKYSDNHTEYKYGVNKDNVIIIKTGELDEGVESDMTLYHEMMNLGKRDMSNPVNYNNFCAVFDIQNFMDYFAAQIYIYNEDWPQNNTQLWRVRNAERGNPVGDGKWRWMMYDTEFSMGIYSNGRHTGQEDMDTFDFILNGPHHDHENNVMFKNLLTNNDFCRQFVITMMDLYNVNFDYDANIAKLNQMADVYKPLMGKADWQYDSETDFSWNDNDDETGTYFTRWGFPWDWFDFDEQIDHMRNYLNSMRTAMINDYLPAYFGHLGINAGNLYTVTLSSNVSGASITINTTTPSLASGSWTGKYYSALPVTVTANVPAGLSFSGWTVTGGAATNPSASTTTVNFNGNVKITANYSK